MPDVDMCLSCAAEIRTEKERRFVNFRYEVPGIPGQTVIVACVCEGCSIESNDPKKFPGMEAVINARAIRFEHPDKYFTP